jgi:transcriptional regulator with XRE-family HTH domain
MTKPQKRLSLLPPDVGVALAQIKDSDLRDDYIRAIRAKGWTLESIALVCSVSRERIRQISNSPSTGLLEGMDLIVPELPMSDTQEKKAREFVEPSPEILARLLELKPFAEQVRSSSPLYRAEAEEYSRLLDYAHRVEGVTIYRLAKRIGVTHPAIRFRLARYGYKPSAKGMSKVYKPIQEKNRV